MDMQAIDRGNGQTAGFKDYMKAMTYEPEKPKTTFLNKVKELING